MERCTKKIGHLLFVAMRPKKSSGGETLLQKKADVCLSFSQKKCVLKNKITCRQETSLTGTGTAQLPEKVRRNPEQMREGYPKKRRSYERKFKQISGTAAVGVHDHEPDCQRISRYAGKKAAQTESSAAAEEAPQSEETAETAELETTPAETESSESTAETPAEEPTETPAAPAEDQTPAGSDETETPSADEDASGRYCRGHCKKTVKRLPIPQKKRAGSSR